MGKDKGSRTGSDEKDISAQDKQWAEELLKTRNDEVSFLDWVKLKAKTFDPRILLIGRARFYFANGKHKVEREGHLVELKAIDSKEPNIVTITFESFNVTLQTSKADHLINTIVAVYAAAFPGVPPNKAFNLNVEPSSRVRGLDSIGSNESSGCGGFNETYKIFSDYYQTPVREDIIWDVANLFPKNNVTQFNLDDLEQPVTPEHLLPIFAALRYNTYFTGLIAKNTPLDIKKTLPEIGKCLSCNTTITKLVLSNIGMNKDSCALLMDGIKSNPDTSVNIIDFSRNQLDDKAVASLANCIGAQKNGIIQLNLSKCQISKNGLSQVAQAFRKNAHTISTLSSLNLADNHLDAEGSSSLSSWLANPNKLQELNISNTNANLEVIMPALVRGCAEIRRISVSDNKISKKAVQSLTQFLQATDSLSYLNLDNTSLAVEDMVLIAQSIGENPYLKSFELSLAKNRLSLAGARQIAVFSSSAANITKLNLADNDFGDEGMSMICQTLANATGLQSINLSRNYSAKPGKARAQAVEDLILFTCSDCPLEQLTICGNKNNALRNDILAFIDALGTNDSLLYLDISGHQFGNKGAIAIGKMLQTNSKLRHLQWEDSGSTLFGFNAVASGLERNRTLKEMPLPILDIANALKSDRPEALQKSTKRIQDLLARNQNPKAFQGVAAGSFNQFSILSSGEREHLERLKFKIKSTNKIMSAEQKLILADAENNDNNMASIYGMAEAHQQVMSDEIRSKLKELARDITPVVDTHFRNMVDGLLKTLSERYQSLDSDTVRRVNTSVNLGVELLELSAVEKVLADSASAEISAKANEVFKSALEIATDYIYEKLIDGLVTVVDDIKTEPESIHHTTLSTISNVPTIDEPEPSPASSAPGTPSPSPAKPAVPDRSPRQERKEPPSDNTTTTAPAASPGGLKKPGPAVPPPRGGSPGVRGMAARGRGLPAGLDPSKMIPGARPPMRPVIPRDDPPPSVAEDVKKPAPATPAKTGGLFGKKPAPSPASKPIGGTKKPSPAGKPPAVKKVAKPSGDTGNMKAIDVALKEHTDTPVLAHVTKDRPMVKQNRRPPTRRPRAA